MKSIADSDKKEPEYGSSEIIIIDNRKDVFQYAVPLDGSMPVQFMKKLAAQGLANLIVQKIEPDFEEMNNFEIMRYIVVVKRYKPKNIKK